MKRNIVVKVNPRTGHALLLQTGQAIARRAALASRIIHPEHNRFIHGECASHLALALRTGIVCPFPQ